VSNTNLPRPASSFVGRDRERAELVELVRAQRLVTLSGPGGSGKTRLSIEAASDVVGAFKAGVFWIGLAALRDPALVLETVGQTLGARVGLVDHIGERELLLLLDNLEQVVEVASELASLVEVCPNLHLLVTSRELLRVRGEVEYAVPPLSDPEAVTLFCERSGLGPDETIAELCRRLDNLPLAVELAAARTRVLTPPQILDRLAERLDLLRGGRDAEARQQTLRATIEWSHELLAGPEQQLFARLAVFAGGWTLEAAEAVVEADVDGLQSLIDKSLVRQTDGRFWMLETIRELARERLGLAEDFQRIGRRHAEWYLALGEAAEPFLKGADQPAWLQRLEEEHDNLRQSLEWFFDHEEPGLALRLAGALWLFWWMHGHVTEARRWLKRALDAAPDEASEARARALDGAGYLAVEQGETEEGLALLEASVAYAKQAGAKAWAAIAAATLCGIRAEVRTPDREETLAEGEEAIGLARAAGDDFALAIALNNIGGVMSVLGENQRAGDYLEEGLMVRRRIGHASGIALSLCNVAELALLAGDTTKAARMFAEAAEIATSIGDKRHTLFALAGLGKVAYREEQWDVAGTHARESLRLAQELGMKPLVVEDIFYLARTAMATGDTGRAVRLAAAAAFHLSPLAPHRADDPAYQEIIRNVKAASDPETWERASAEGSAMTLDEVADYALSSA
jgi:predicted ATPase